MFMSQNGAHMGRFFFLHFTLTKHEFANPRMMILLVLLLSFTESAGKGMTDAGRDTVRFAFRWRNNLPCHDAKIPPI